MQPFPLFGDDQKADSALRKVQQLAMGIPIQVTTTPTTANGLIDENQWGFDGSNLFITLKGTTYKVALTAV